jgi:hypothetical protein
MDARFIVLFDSDAGRDLDSLKGGQERNAVYAVIDKLRMLGPDLTPPSCGRAKEARPCGRSTAGSGRST